MGTVVSVTKEVTFDSAHFLSNYDGPCANLHGHTYKLQVTVVGPIDPETGMVLDFVGLSALLKEHVLDRFDHQCINFVARELQWRATAELMVVYIAEQLKYHLPEGVKLGKLVLYETPTSFVEYDPKGSRTLGTLGILEQVLQKREEVDIESFSTMIADVVDGLE